MSRIANIRDIVSELWLSFRDTANPWTKCTEVMSAEELEKQSSFESFDYYKPYPSMYMTHLREHYNKHRVGETSVPSFTPPVGHSEESKVVLPIDELESRQSITDAVKKYDSVERNASLRWLLHVLIAISVGVIATAISYGVELIEEYRSATLYRLIKNAQFRIVGYMWGYFFLLSTSVVLVAIAGSVIVFFEPAAAGGGISDVIAYLNGVQMPKAMNFRTFVAKSISCMCAVAGGLPVGLEAPLIHLGAITGAGVTQGRSRTLGFQTKLFQAFRNNKDRRDFITAGSACGVSAAFGAPIGGLLFVMEEVSSFWDHSASGQIFLATMICFTTISMMRSVLEDQQLLGWVSNAVSVLFEVNLTIPLNLLSIVPSFFLGILCGAFAAVFTKVNLMIINYRRRHIRPLLIRRFLEPLIIVVLYASLSYIPVLMAGCQPMSEMSTEKNGTMLIWGTENEGRLFNATCSSSDRYAPLGTLTIGTGKGTIRHLFSRQTIGEFPAGNIFIFLVLYTVFSCWSSGTSVSGGLVVPSLVIGAAFGRLYGQFLWFLVVRGLPGVERGYWASQAWMDPGVFALIGAGAFLSGTSRMTMSICVIMVELSSELHYLLPVMVAIVMSKTIADLISEPLYHEMLRLDFVPYLPAHLLRPEFEQLTAADVMASDVVTLRLREKTSVVMQALRQTRHHAFPVVEAVQEESTAHTVHSHSLSSAPRTAASGSLTERPVRYKFVGLVTREDVQIYLSLPALHNHTVPSATLPVEGDLSTERESKGIGENDGYGGRLAPSVSAINKMTWMEWLTHKTSLFFVIGGKKWSEVWARTNRQRDGLTALDNVGSSPTGPVENSPFFVDERQLPAVLDFSLIVNRSPWVIPPFFNLQMAYYTFRMMGLRHIVVVHGDAVVGIITRKDLLVDALRRCVRELRVRMDCGDSGSPSLPPSLESKWRQGRGKIGLSVAREWTAVSPKAGFSAHPQDSLECYERTSTPRNIKNGQENGDAATGAVSPVPNLLTFEGVDAPPTLFP